jgi:hypothetical protein
MLIARHRCRGWGSLAGYPSINVGDIVLLGKGEGGRTRAVLGPYHRMPLDSSGGSRNGVHIQDILGRALMNWDRVEMHRINFDPTQDFLEALAKVNKNFSTSVSFN